MKLAEARSLAHGEMDAWGLDVMGWRFSFDRAKQRFGCCHWTRKEITLSAPLVELNDEAQVTDTIRHEIAHALAGSAAGHGPVWKAKARMVGATPKRCYSNAAVVQPPAPYLWLCDNCGLTIKRHRRTNKGQAACPVCCRRYAGGRFDTRFAMRWVKNDVVRPV